MIVAIFVALLSASSLFAAEPKSNSVSIITVNTTVTGLPTTVPPAMSTGSTTRRRHTTRRHTRNPNTSKTKSTSTNKPSTGTSMATSASSGAPTSTTCPKLDNKVIIDLTPALGAVPSAIPNPNGPGCCGPIGQPPQCDVISCHCPPGFDEFVHALIANVGACHAVNNTHVPVHFPTGNTTKEELVRIRAFFTTLENFKGRDKGCPKDSTTLPLRVKELLGKNSSPSD